MPGDAGPRKSGSQWRDKSRARALRQSPFRHRRGQTPIGGDQPEEPIAIDLAELGRLNADEEACGKALTRWSCGQAMSCRSSKRPSPREPSPTATLTCGYTSTRHLSSTPCTGSPARPALGDPIATRSSVLVSRYLTSPDWRPIPAVGSTTSTPYRRRRPRDIGEFTPNREAWRRWSRRGARACPDRARRLQEVKELARAAPPWPGCSRPRGRRRRALHRLPWRPDRRRSTAVSREGDGTADPVDGRRLVERLSALEAPDGGDAVLLSVGVWRGRAVERRRGRAVGARAPPRGGRRLGRGGDAGQRVHDDGRDVRAGLLHGAGPGRGRRSRDGDGAARGARPPRWWVPVLFLPAAVGPDLLQAGVHRPSRQHVGDAAAADAHGPSRPCWARGWPIHPRLPTGNRAPVRGALADAARDAQPGRPGAGRPVPAGPQRRHDRPQPAHRLPGRGDRPAL